MIQKLLTAAFILFVTLLTAQNTDEIMAEARLLYNSEKASWNGTDILLEHYPDRMERTGGYFSYTSDEGRHVCVFYDRQEEPKIHTSFSFDDTFLPETVKVDTLTRAMSPLEKDLYEIRVGAIKVAYSVDPMFKHYEDMNYNYIPLIDGNDKKVYILTGPTKPGVIVFGNDYLITFNKKNRVKKKKSLHNNIIVMDYGNREEQIITGIHSHLKSTGELITVTDVCTLMLYCPYTGWESYYVMSEKYVSIWQCETSELLVMERKAWDKILEHQEKKDEE